MITYIIASKHNRNESYALIKISPWDNLKGQPNLTTINFVLRFHCQSINFCLSTSKTASSSVFVHYENLQWRMTCAELSWLKQKVFFTSKLNAKKCILYLIITLLVCVVIRAAYSTTTASGQRRIAVLYTFFMHTTQLLKYV